MRRIEQFKRFELFFPLSDDVGSLNLKLKIDISLESERVVGSKV